MTRDSLTREVANLVEAVDRDRSNRARAGNVSELESDFELDKDLLKRACDSLFLLREQQHLIDCNEKALVSAYRKLRGYYHPDKYNNDEVLRIAAEKKFQEWDEFIKKEKKEAAQTSSSNDWDALYALLEEARQELVEIANNIAGQDERITVADETLEACGERFKAFEKEFARWDQILSSPEPESAAKQPTSTSTTVRGAIRQNILTSGNSRHATLMNCLSIYGSRINGWFRAVSNHQRAGNLFADQEAISKMEMKLERHDNRWSLTRGIIRLFTDIEKERSRLFYLKTKQEIEVLGKFPEDNAEFRTKLDHVIYDVNMRAKKVSGFSEMMNLLQGLQKNLETHREGLLQLTILQKESPSPPAEQSNSSAAIAGGVNHPAPTRHSFSMGAGVSSGLALAQRASSEGETAAPPSSSPSVPS